MTDNKTDEQVMAEEKNRKDSGSSSLQNTFASSVTGEAPTTPGFEIKYVSHKSQGLQSASDMWIDKGRLFDGLSKEKMDLDSIKKLSRQ
ncbi:hypothetical protein RE476_05015 [Methanolobus mangrovi]|uniref:Uncharacterized protein n=1 Tax=Methanolobus mangrovi TaxID=3072977 RepID=A0AA51YKG3_9EURY|nr:hypothetical protein [Methanolobus mangrovi]WMW23194.1 hypothetical protein RE476_05015 [Methanolobus mangrovi]